jgi:hypothetical protein
MSEATALAPTCSNVQIATSPSPPPQIAPEQALSQAVLSRSPNEILPIFKLSPVRHAAQQASSDSNDEDAYGAFLAAKQRSRADQTIIAALEADAKWLRCEKDKLAKDLTALQEEFDTLTVHSASAVQKCERLEAENARLQQAQELIVRLHIGQLQFTFDMFDSDDMSWLLLYVSSHPFTSWCSHGTEIPLQ